MWYFDNWTLVCSFYIPTITFTLKGTAVVGWQLATAHCSLRLLVHSWGTNTCVNLLAKLFLDITVLLTSVLFETKIWQMLGLAGLVPSAGMRFAGCQFCEMLTMLKIISKSSYVATNILANMSWPANFYEWSVIVAMNVFGLLTLLPNPNFTNALLSQSMVHSAQCSWHKFMLVNNCLVICAFDCFFFSWAVHIFYHAEKWSRKVLAADIGSCLGLSIDCCTVLDGLVSDRWSGHH